MHIYVSLLKQMAPEHLLATSAKICAEILAAASDGMLDIGDQTGQSVLQVPVVCSFPCVIKLDKEICNWNAGTVECLLTCIHEN